MAKLQGRQSVKHKLRTGQTITLTPGDERLIRGVYDYLQGFSVRCQLTEQLEHTRLQLLSLGISLEKSAMNTKKIHVSLPSKLPIDTLNHNKLSERQSDGVTEHDFVQRVRDEYKIVEDKLACHISMDHKISFDDIEAVLLSLGINNPQKRIIDQMIWEADELADEVICWDEFQLLYRRNLDDTMGNEPSSFFRLVEFLSFDQSRKGFIIEDDCMEILFVRYGGNKLESELKFIFGNNLRSNGGDGTMTFEGYLSAWLSRSGRRAPLC